MQLHEAISNTRLQFSKVAEHGKSSKVASFREGSVQSPTLALVSKAQNTTASCPYTKLEASPPSTRAPVQRHNMAIAPSCCLNLRPPTPPSPPPNARATQAAWFKNGSWRSQCVVGMACIIIGVEMDLASQANLATAKDLQYLLVESKEKTKGDRWSDKRICPPWRLNSLETIVPENLPRPSARRRWEEVGNLKNVPAPAIKVIVKSRSSSNNCFTM